MKEFNDWFRFQRWAEEHGYDSIEFMAMMPSGPKKARWLDAYMGLVKFDVLDGFVTVSQLEEIAPGAVCFVLTETEQAA